MRVKETHVDKMRSVYPLLTADTVFEVTGETDAYEKRTLAVKPVSGAAEGLPTLLYAGTVVRAWEGAAREKGLRDAGHSW